MAAAKRIVHVEMREKGYSYGAVFVGMPDTESARIEVYQTIEDIRDKQ